MTYPYFCLAICFPTTCETKKTDLKFVSTTASHSSSVRLRVFFLTLMPALFTNISNLGNVCNAVFTVLSIELLLVTSHGSPIIFLPVSFSNSFAVFSISSFERETITTSAPARASPAIYYYRCLIDKILKGN